ncbi:Uncharacterised protein [Salmonella enterica subsp. enterica]|nr:Uncharacterised protein [Salmonella enterica subsp. enterica]
MEPKKGEAKVQKVKNWSACLDIPDCYCAYRSLDSVLSLQPPGTGSYLNHHQCGRH